jgi:hypothetical protein
VVIEDPKSRGRPYHSHNHQQGSQKPSFKGLADTRTHNASKPHVQRRGVAWANPLPFDGDQSPFRPPSSVVAPRNFQETDREHSMRMLEPPLAKQAHMNSNSHRLRRAHQKIQNRNIDDSSWAKPVFSPSLNADTVEIRGTRTHQNGSIIEQNVDSGNTLSSTVSSRIESNGSANKNH